MAKARSIRNPGAPVATPVDQLGKLRQDAAAAHQTYDASVRRLAQVLSLPSDAPSLAVIQSHVEEYGPSITAELTTTDPSALGLPNTPAEPKHLRQSLDDLAVAGYTLCLAVGRREDHLARTDPKHTRLYCHSGREFALDLKTATWTYADDPQNPIPVGIAHLERLKPPGSRQRRRTRDRDR